VTETRPDPLLEKPTYSGALSDRLRRMVSLDPADNPELLSAEGAVDTAIGFIPGVGGVQAGRDFERARRGGDSLGMGLSALGLVPGGKMLGKIVMDGLEMGKAWKRQVDMTKRLADPNIPPAERAALEEELKRQQKYLGSRG
jgi:hypothetical protein